MKIVYLCCIAYVLPNLMLAQAKKNKKTLDGFHLFSYKNINIDFKFIDPDKGNFGIDYALKLTDTIKTKNIRNDSNARPNVKYNFVSNGFITVKGDANQFNSIINEFNVELSPFFKQKKLKETKPFEDQLDMNDEEAIEYARQQAASLNSPFWLRFNIHAKHEATQNFKDHDYAIGATVNITTSVLNRILDLPFGLLRIKKYNFPRHLDVSILYDYVSSLNNTALKNLRNNNNANRLSLYAEWETGIFQRERISFAYKYFYELNAPLQIKNNHLDANQFYQIKLEHPLKTGSDKTRKTISIKYTEGALPPNFNKGYVLGGGFSVEF
jgi:hypothetical protein